MCTKYAKGICWINDTRIPFVNEGDIPNDMDKTHLEEDRLWNGVKGLKPFLYQQNNKGRFTPNLLVSDDMLNIGDKGTNSRYYDLDLWFERLINEVLE